MKSFFTYIFFTFIIIGSVNSQSYIGYFGKRNVAFLDLGLGLTPQSQGLKNRGLFFARPNFKMGIELERSLNSKMSICFQWKYMPATYSESNYNTNLANYFSKFILDYGGMAKLSLQTYGISAKSYINKRGGIAPNGKYFQIGLNYNRVKVIDQEMIHYVSKGYNYGVVEHIAEIPNSSYYSVLVGFGNQKMIKSKNNYFVLNTAIYSNLSLSLINRVGTLQPIEETASLVLKSYLSELDLVTFKVGLGYLF